MKRAIVIGIFILSAAHLIAAEQKFSSTAENITAAWIEPNLSAKKPLSYGSGFVEGYPDGYTKGYTKGYSSNAVSNISEALPQSLKKGTEYLLGVQAGFQKGYKDGFEKGTEDYQRWEQRKWQPASQQAHLDNKDFSAGS